MSQAAGVLTSVITVATGVALFIASGIRQYIGRTPVTTPTPPPAPADLWLPCHTTHCGHMSTIHDPTPHGPTCRACGHATNGGTQ